MKLAIDEDRFAQVGLVFDIVGSMAVFGVPTDDPAVFDTVKAGTDGDNVFLFPERSSAHKRILARLG